MTDDRALREAAHDLAQHVRLLRADAEYAWNAWRRNMTLSNAIRRDDAKKRLDDLEYAEPVALWVLDRTSPTETAGDG